MSIRDKAGRSYTVAKKLLGPQGIGYFVHDGERLVARAVLNPNKGAITDVVVIDLADRRRGICAALYDVIEHDLGRPLKPSRQLLGDGRAFWAARRRGA